MHTPHRAKRHLQGTAVVNDGVQPLRARADPGTFGDFLTSSRCSPPVAHFSPERCSVDSTGQRKAENETGRDMPASSLVIRTGLSPHCNLPIRKGRGRGEGSRHVLLAYSSRCTAGEMASYSPIAPYPHHSWRLTDNLEAGASSQSGVSPHALPLVAAFWSPLCIHPQRPTSCGNRARLVRSHLRPVRFLEMLAPGWSPEESRSLIAPLGLNCEHQ